MNTANYYTPAPNAKAVFTRLYVVISSLRETTLTPDRRDWFNNTRDEFRYLLNIANGYEFNEYQQAVIDHGCNEFNEGALYYLGATIANPQLHYAN